MRVYDGGCGAPFGDCVLGVPAVVRSNDADVVCKFIRPDTQYNVVTLMGATRCIVECVGSCARPSAPGPPPTPAVVPVLGKLSAVAARLQLEYTRDLKRRGCLE